MESSRLQNIKSLEDHFGFDQETIKKNHDYHTSKGIPFSQNVFRPGSGAFFSTIMEAKRAFDLGLCSFSDVDKEIFEETEMGEIAEYEGGYVMLDLPLEASHDITVPVLEAMKKNPKLNHPMRGGSKKYYVYVRDPRTKNIKKISFGDVHGGLKARVSNPEARKNFAARHNCKDKKDKTKAGYWACRINRYGHLWGGKTYPGYW